MMMSMAGGKAFVLAGSGAAQLGRARGRALELRKQQGERDKCSQLRPKHL
jgi:hypothetical protein